MRTWWYLLSRSKRYVLDGFFSVSECCFFFHASFLHQLTRVFLSTLWQQGLAEVTEGVLGCDAAQQANLSKPLMQLLVGWESRLKVTSIF